jgi:hypothetical protein
MAGVPPVFHRLLMRTDFDADCLRDLPRGCVPSIITKRPARRGRGHRLQPVLKASLDLPQ